MTNESNDTPKTPRKRRGLFAILALAAMGVLAVNVAFAGGGWGGHCGPHGAMNASPDEKASFVAQRVADRADATEQQQADIEAVLVDLFTDMDALKAEKETFRAQAKDVLTADTVDADALQALAERYVHANVSPTLLGISGDFAAEDLTVQVLDGESDDRNNTTATPIDISCDENGEWNVIAPLSMDPWEVEFRGTAVDPDGNSVWQLRSEPSSDSHRQLSSYDIRGSFRWSVELDWSIEDIAPDADGNFYAVGGPTYFLPAYPRVVKFSPSGEQIWELRLDAGEQYYKPRYVTTLPSGEVLVAGRATCSSAGTTQCTSDFPGGPILGPGESSSFVLAFDSSGGMRWQRFLTPKPYTETGFIGELSSNPQGDFAYLVRDERSSPWNIAVSNDSGDHSWPVDSRRISHVTLLDSGETVVSANSTGFPEFAPAHFVRFSEQGTADAPTAIEVGGLGEFTIHDVAATRTGIVASGVWLTDDWEEPTWTDGLGPTLFHSGGYAGWVAHFTSNGAPTWGYIFEKPFGQHSHVFGARVDPEGGFIVRGQADLGTKLGSEVPEPHYEEYLFLSRIRP